MSVANKLTPQQIIDADAKQMADHVWRWYQPGLHCTVSLTEVRKVLLRRWASQLGMPDFMKTERFNHAWQDGGVFAESFDRQWRERVVKEQGRWNG